MGEDITQPAQEKVQKMLNAPKPKTKKEARSLLGLLGFYREFLSNFDAATSPLGDLVKKQNLNEMERT